MKIELTNYNVIVKEKITWKDVLEYENIVIQEQEAWKVLLFFIDTIIEKVEKIDEKVINKVKIEEVIFDLEETTREDLVKLVDELTKHINLKKK